MMNELKMTPRFLTVFSVHTHTHVCQGQIVEGTRENSRVVHFLLLFILFFLFVFQQSHILIQYEFCLPLASSFKFISVSPALLGPWNKNFLVLDVFKSTFLRIESRVSFYFFFPLIFVLQNRENYFCWWCTETSISGYNTFLQSPFEPDFPAAWS